MPLPNLVRFDWAMKRLLRQKSNFVVLEGFLSSLLNEKITIRTILESEGNKENPLDKYNRVDLMAEDSKGELFIVEIQNNREVDYFLRMLYGVSKAVTEYISEGETYENIRKVYSVNIVYFDLGQGTDYVYHGRTEFRGIHDNDILKLSKKQEERFIRQDAGELFPEYYVLRVDEFDKQAVSPLDEWILFLKTGEISEDAKAPGLAEARQRLRFAALSRSEQKAYLASIEDWRVNKSVMNTYIDEGKDKGREEGIEIGLEKGRKEGEEAARREMARNMRAKGIAIEVIVECSGLTPEEIESIL